MDMITVACIERQECKVSDCMTICTTLGAM